MLKDKTGAAAPGGDGVPREKLLSCAEVLARRVLHEVPGGKDAAWVRGDCDDLEYDDIYDLLLERGDAPALIVVGDCRGARVDVYDAVLRLAEDKYSYVRQQKYSSGAFVVIMASPLKELNGGERDG